MPNPPADKPPAQKPIVRAGDVLFTLGQEISEAARVVQEHVRIGQRLAVYAELHPERHAHLARFLAGDDQVAGEASGAGEARERSMRDDEAAAHEAESRQADAAAVG